MLSIEISMDLGLRRGRGSLEEVEIAALVRLGDVLLVERAEAALVTRRAFFPMRRGAATRMLRVGHLQLQLSGAHVEFDQCARPRWSTRRARESW